MRTITFLICCALAMIGTHALADLMKAELVFNQGNWKVLKAKDSMTDKVSCTGILRDDYKITLSRDSFSISYSSGGGAQSYRIRIDEERAGHDWLASKLEMGISSIILNGGEFRRLLTAKRLRLSGQTVVGKRIEEDLPLDGIGGAHSVIVGNKCN